MPKHKNICYNMLDKNKILMKERDNVEVMKKNLKSEKTDVRKTDFYIATSLVI